MENRDRIIDTVRGIGITAIVIGHLCYDMPFRDDSRLVLFKIIYSFHVMIFFILAGHIVKRAIGKYSLREYTKKRFLRLLIPYLSFVLLNILSNIIHNHLSSLVGVSPLYPQITLRNVAGAFIMSNDLFMNRLGIFGSFWFFPAYFLCNVIFFVLLNVKHMALRIPLVLLILPALSIFFTDYLGHSSIPWGVNIALLVLPFMWIGTYYESFEGLLYKVRNPFVILAMIALHVSIIASGGYASLMHIFSFDNYFVFYFLAILGYFWVLLVAMNIADSLLGKTLAYIGSYTLPIFGMHRLIIDYASFFRDYFFTSYLTAFIFYLLTLVLAIVIPVIVTRIIIENSKRLKFLFLGIP